MRSSEKTGQQLLSHITLLTLVMAGILIAGPYVIRAWNANLKGWEDSAIDSMQDPLTEAGSSSISLGGTCNPSSSWVNEGCFLGITDYCTDTVLSCTPQEMLSTLTFSPPNCQCAIIPPPTRAVCTAEECCCTAPVSTGRCGVNADFVTGLTKSDNVACPGLLSTVTNKYDDGSGNWACQDGYEEVYFFCGSDDNTDDSQRRYGCIPDIACIFQCGPVVAAQSGVGFVGICSGDTTRLPSSLPYTYTDDCNSLDSQTRKCEIQCDNVVHHYAAPW